MNDEEQTDVHISFSRYTEFRDASGSWAFDIRTYHDDINSIVPADISPDPDPQEAYRAAVFIEGLIQEQNNTDDWSNGTFDQFTSFDSAVEIEAVARALRQIADCNSQ
ncbi:MAG: hypothetical protein J07HQX50_01483 [Haloquadratum sp. J07HQX50]|nr:MAG: hypothetical protein J07HQX50_01483 [Haloquadratum sp. J07HQX50]